MWAAFGVGVYGLVIGILGFGPGLGGEFALKEAFGH